MVDHKRLDALTGLVEHSGAKLIAVGDGKQLPSIGPGGMFDRSPITSLPLNSRAFIAPLIPPSSARGEHYKRANLSARWRTT
jgi:ATP-dependent exoDNAse (exonuclease V) alpha subunit